MCAHSGIYVSALRTKVKPFPLLGVIVMEVPDDLSRPCNDCGGTEWVKFEESKPSDYPGTSDVVKHYFKCTGCGGHGYIYENSAGLQYTGNLR